MINTLSQRFQVFIGFQTDLTGSIENYLHELRLAKKSVSIPFPADNVVVCGKTAVPADPFPGPLEQALALNNQTSNNIVHLLMEFDLY